jgi:hypothetical protein
MSAAWHDAEWLESDGLGGYAFGRADGVRTRRYHALLAVATTPPTGRVVLVNGCDVSIETDAGTVALSAQRYTPDVTHPDGPSRLLSFALEPWPTWTYALPDGRAIVQELVVLHGAPIAAMSWRVTEPGVGARDSVVVPDPRVPSPAPRIRCLTSSRPTPTSAPPSPRTPPASTSFPTPSRGRRAPRRSSRC